MRALYRQLNPFQYNVIGYNPREVYRLLLGEEPSLPAAPGASGEGDSLPPESIAELKDRYLPALRRRSEALIAGTPVAPEDEAAVALYQQFSVTRMKTTAAAIPVMPPQALPEGVLDLGESWRAIHLLLTGNKEEQRKELREGILGLGQSIFDRFSNIIPMQSGPDKNLFSMAIHGGDKITVSDRRLEQGPARVLSPEDVRRIADALDKIDPARLLEGYPLLAESGIPAPDANALARSYARLRHFYMDATANGSAVVSCLL